MNDGLFTMMGLGRAVIRGALFIGALGSSVLSTSGLVYGDPAFRPQVHPVVLPSMNYVYPVMGPRLSSDYGWRSHPRFKVVRHHHGIDLAAPSGAPIRSIAQGKVMYADPYAGYGKLIVIKHPNGLTSHYGHCASIEVSPGQQVEAGTVIGRVGSTGISTGPHLHFEIRRNGTPQNPEDILPGLAAQSKG